MGYRIQDMSCIILHGTTKKKLNHDSKSLYFFAELNFTIFKKKEEEEGEEKAKRKSPPKKLLYKLGV